LRRGDAECGGEEKQHGERRRAKGETQSAALAARRFAPPPTVPFGINHVRHSSMPWRAARTDAARRLPDRKRFAAQV
jgi:hypothetical protein